MNSKQRLKQAKYLLKSINKNMSKLKKYDKLETKEKIEIIKYDVPVQYYDFKEDKLRDLYITFAIIIGIIDGFIGKRKRQINEDKNKKTAYRYEIEIEYAKKIRLDVVNDFGIIENKLNDRDKKITKCIKDAVTTHPSYIKFNEIHREGKNLKHNKVYMEFIDNYANNYMVASNLDARHIRIIYRNYKKLFNKLNNNYIMNTKKVEKAKLKEKSKKYINY